MSRNSNGGCSCPSCQYTDSLDAWPAPDLDQAKLARYLRAKSTGKFPADSAYSAHRAHAMRIFPGHGSDGREFTAAELRSRSVKVYHAPAMSAPVLAMPSWGWKTTAEYIEGFDRANGLKSTEYHFCAPQDLKEAA